MADATAEPKRVKARHELTAEESLARDLSNPFIGRLTVEKKAEIIARNVLQEDMGEFRHTPIHYAIDEATRDRLIVHSRQEVSQGLLLAINIHRRQRRTEAVLALVLAGLAFLIWRTF